jgi:exodeoxyribonuclease-3
MFIASYNVNGIRSAENKGLSSWLQTAAPDVVCLQEIKADESQIPGTFNLLGYRGYYHSAKKKGYSGVGILTKREPLSVHIGCGIDWIDAEGRVIRAEFPEATIFSIYFPSGTTGDIRQAVKYQFLDAIFDYLKPWSVQEKPVIVCGDYNIAHKEIDIHDPKGNKESSGFLPEERAWMDKLFASGYHDVFRKTVGTVPHIYSWWTFRAGAKGNNKGWRIDYQAGNAAALAAAKSARIDAHLNFSDHAPVIVAYEF